MREIKAKRQTDDRVEAFRHFIWQAGLVLTLGYMEAMRWGNAHESGDPNWRDSARDQRNNRLGRNLGLIVSRSSLPVRIMACSYNHGAIVGIAKAWVKNGLYSRR